ncbi:MAG: flagellar hook-basal body protein [Thermodesulfobacteriota bacterium]|nr:flagellar hook-basal body protein [Thermodesulfobacteriota bacterium]
MIQKFRFNTISNNLANINTNAFKKDIISFNEMLTMKYVSGTDFTPGPVKYTGNELDVALETKGFFKIQTPKGIRYTREGAFKINDDGKLATQNGDIVLGQNGSIPISGNEVSINNNGQVIMEDNLVDTILVVDFAQTQLLKKEGSSYYIYQGKENDIYTPENINLQQKYLEGSNVSPTKEMIKMVEAFRAFESSQKAIQCIDEITRKMINDAGQI